MAPYAKGQVNKGTRTNPIYQATTWANIPSVGFHRTCANLMRAAKRCSTQVASLFASHPAPILHILS